MRYDPRNRATLAELAPNTRRAALNWYEYCVANNVEVLIVDAVRTIEEQRDNVARGVSQTMKSYHLVGQAFDFVPVLDATTGVVSWNPADWSREPWKGAVAYAKSLGFEWGGDWKKKPTDKYGWDCAHLEFHHKGYGTDLVLEEAKPVDKFKPQIVKERIIAVGGKLMFIPLTPGTGAYNKPGTDVRLIRIPKGRATLDFEYQRGARVSDIGRSRKADIAFNFSFFHDGLTLGDAEDHDSVVSSAYGKMLQWHELASVNGWPVIGQLDKKQTQDWLVQAGPLLLWEGKQVWKERAKVEQINPDIANSRCQRTFVGLAANGDFLIAVADGRTKSDLGLTLEEMALYMLSKGAVTALNGDGGGSSALWVNSGGTYTPYGGAFKAGSINQSLNTGANERVVHHAVLVYLS